MGLERLVLALLDSVYKVESSNGEDRVYLAFPESIAPIKFCVSPLLKNKPELVNLAREVYSSLKIKYKNVIWDDNGNIGKRYRRQDEIGTPHCVVVDFDSLEDQTVTIRDRDTTLQKRVKISEL
jgi:glycyl-tRNA synthetase